MKLYKIGYSKINNKGLFANKDIKKGTKIIDYIGKIITKKETDRNVLTLSIVKPKLEHFFSSPEEGSLNRLIQIDYTIRIQTLTNLSSISA